MLPTKVPLPSCRVGAVSLRGKGQLETQGQEDIGFPRTEVTVLAAMQHIVPSTNPTGRKI